MFLFLSFFCIILLLSLKDLADIGFHQSPRPKKEQQKRQNHHHQMPKVREICDTNESDANVFILNLFPCPWLFQGIQQGSTSYSF